MKTTRYRFEQSLEQVKPETTNWLIDEFKSILESNKDYPRKCDYIGFSIANMDVKVASIDEEIKELQELKKKLKAAKEIALITGAKVFNEYGIDKLDGAGISSITLTKPVSSSHVSLTVDNEGPLIEAGFYKKVIDISKVSESYQCGEYLDLINHYCTIEILKDIKPMKLKINKRRGGTNNQGEFEPVGVAS